MRYNKTANDCEQANKEPSYFFGVLFAGSQIEYKRIRIALQLLKGGVSNEEIHKGQVSDW
jgi:hypothetical protein